MAATNPRVDRLHSERAKEDQRGAFARDRDRILYTSAFRRLAGVTQVVGPLEGHIFHNRLTHSLEAAQVARRLAEKLRDDYKELAEEGGGIDPDVAEAAALAHDIGHPPFGHIGEEELAHLARKAGALEGFEGNAQSFRIVTRLAAHRDNYSGINLTRATLNAILKYPWLYKNRPNGTKFGAYSSEREAFDFARTGNTGDIPSFGSVNHGSCGRRGLQRRGP